MFKRNRSAADCGGVGVGGQEFEENALKLQILIIFFGFYLYFYEHTFYFEPLGVEDLYEREAARKHDLASYLYVYNLSQIQMTKLKLTENPVN